MFFMLLTPIWRSVYDVLHYFYGYPCSSQPTVAFISHTFLDQPNWRYPPSDRADTQAPGFMATRCSSPYQLWIKTNVHTERGNLLTTIPEGTNVPGAPGIMVTPCNSTCNDNMLIPKVLSHVPFGELMFAWTKEFWAAQPALWTRCST